MRKQYVTTALLFATISIAVISFQSCTKTAQALKYNLKMKTGSVHFIIPASTFTVGNNMYGPVSNSYNVDSFIKAQTGTLLGIDNISSVKVASCTLTLDDPDTTSKNFGNFESCYAEFYSDKYPSPFQVSDMNIPDADTRSINMSVDTSAELKSYIGTQYTYTLYGKLRRPAPKDMHCTLQYSFNIVVQG